MRCHFFRLWYIVDYINHDREWIIICLSHVTELAEIRSAEIIIVLAGVYFASLLVVEAVDLDLAKKHNQLRYWCAVLAHTIQCQMSLLRGRVSINIDSNYCNLLQCCFFLKYSSCLLLQYFSLFLTKVLIIVLSYTPLLREWRFLHFRIGGTWLFKAQSVSNYSHFFDSVNT